MQDPAPKLFILVVEGSPTHACLIESVLHQAPDQREILTLASGQQVMNLLHRQGDYAEARRPDLILLDLNLPEKDGREVLAEIKTHPQLKRIPTIVLTTSTDEDDVFRTYAQQGNCYVIKSEDLEQLSQVVQRIEEFWLGIVTLSVE
ncbi:response regulator [Phormidium tenue FACHB-886]|nr:response regulator [Phormidium tenue FACHB-886]